MCGALGFSAAARELADHFRVEGDYPDFQPTYNERPTQPYPTIEQHSPNSIHIRRFGFIEPWSPDGSSKLTLFNARDDKIETSKIYKHAFQHSRCLVPANFFYEFLKDGKERLPFVFMLKDRGLFALAGIYGEYHHPKTGVTIPTFAIITTMANEIVGKVHPRMPVILHKEDEDAYLDPDMTEPERIMRFYKSYPSDEMISYRVSQRVNSYRNNDPSLLKPEAEEN